MANPLVHTVKVGVEGDTVVLRFVTGNMAEALALLENMKEGIRKGSLLMQWNPDYESVKPWAHQQ